ncbi:MAG: amidase [Chloroflexi bacterium]|nr:MAG: amidase [Chloroflexota bacterium]
MSNENSSETIVPVVTPAAIAAAARLIGLPFTGAEIELMVETVQKRLTHYEQLRAVSLANHVPPALRFDPAPAGGPAVGAGTASCAIAISASAPISRPHPLEEVAFWPVTQLAHLIHAGQVRSLELTQLYLDRLRRYDPHLKCTVTLTEELALSQARRADEELAAGHDRGPLHGIPWGAKDLLATRGIPTTWGAEPYQGQSFDYDATVVQRLAEAGAVLVAKLSTGALAQGDVWFGGQTRNPWDLDEGSSGSSAGPASATAAGLVGFAIGTETMGSIISPGARCGVTGLRPTFGRVSRHGCMSLSWSMDKIGPMCRSVEDCAVVFNAIYGPDGLDTTVADRPFVWKPAIDLRRLRIGYVPAAFDMEREGKGYDEETLVVLRRLGAELVPITLPDYPHEMMMLILFAEAAAAFDELTRSDQDDRLARQSADAWPNSLRAARLIPAVEYIQANRLRSQLMQEMAGVMAQVDLYLQPCVWGPELALTNYTGHPAVVLPNGFSAAGKPVNSMVFVGQLYGEAELLAVAKAYQDATDFHLRRPALVDSRNSQLPK